jgi:Glycosyl transferase family 11
MRIIARLHDGLGNQLFIYAAARAIAEARGAELLLDSHSGFARDRKYGAISQLSHFAIAAAFAPMQLCYPPPFGRQIRDLQISASRHLPLAHRFVIREADFEAVMAGAPLRSTVRLEGYWQSERYFASIAPKIRDELQVISPLSHRSMELMAEIAQTNSVGLHIRQRRGAHHDHDKPPPTATPQLPFSYYEEAIARVVAQVDQPNFFCFGDNPDWIRERWKFPYPVHFVDHNRTQEVAYEDLALMSACNHFIVGNSTFSWWGAWLSRNAEKYVVAPASEGKFVWGSEKDLIPASWDVLKIDGA